LAAIDKVVEAAEDDRLAGHSAYGNRPLRPRRAGQRRIGQHVMEP